jgi:hypothetical protein
MEGLGVGLDDRVVDGVPDRVADALGRTAPALGLRDGVGDGDGGVAARIRK